MALARSGSGDEAVELFHMLNPANYSRTTSDIARYKVEPYVIRQRHLRSVPACWTRRLELVHGIRWLDVSRRSRKHSWPAARGATFVVDSCIPSSWPEYQIVWQFLDTRYEITVSNPTRRCRGVGKATVDGAPVNPAAIPLVDDGRIHDVQIMLGEVTARPRLACRAGRRARSASEVTSRSSWRCLGFGRQGRLRGHGVFAALGSMEWVN